MNNSEQFDKIKNEVAEEIVKRYGHPVSFWENFQIKNIVGLVMARADETGEDCEIFSAVAERAEEIHENACGRPAFEEDNLQVRQLTGRVLGICCHATATIG